MKSIVILSLLVAVALCSDSYDVCIEGGCCHNGQFKPAQTKCSNAINPCEYDAFCDGYTPLCPERKPRPDGTPCLNTGKCMSGICHVPSCVGLCCNNTMVVEDGTKCGEEGTCIGGTCVVVKGSAKKTAEEQKVIELVRGVIEKDIEELLEVHEKYVLYQRKLGVNGYTDNTLASQFSKLKDLLDPYVAKFNIYNPVAILAANAGMTEAQPKEGDKNVSYVAYVASFVGIALIVVIAVVLFARKKDDTLEYQDDVEKRGSKKNDDYGF